MNESMDHDWEPLDARYEVPRSPGGFRHQCKNCGVIVYSSNRYGLHGINDFILVSSIVGCEEQTTRSIHES